MKTPLATQPSAGFPVPPSHIGAFGWTDVFRERAKQRRAELSRLPSLLGRVLPSIVQARLRGRESWLHALLHHAEQRPQASALLCGSEQVCFADLAARVERAAAFLESEGVRSGDVLGLIGRNCIDYVVLLLAAARLGAPVALISPELDGALLDRALRVANCTKVLVESSRFSRLGAELRSRAIEFGTPKFTAAMATAPARPMASLPKGGELDFAYVYTSGTTGRSKPCRVTHRRAFLASTAFARLIHGLRPTDVVYCALPLYHASPLLLGLGACLISGSTLALSPRFSARRFLSDVRQYDATVLLYVGELGRALSALPHAPDEREHRLRLAVGNGLGETAWRALAERYGIPLIREFYAASEFPGAIVNLTGKVGSLGHVPLERWRGYRLVRVDPESCDIVRDERGRALVPAPGEPGELLLRLRKRPTQPTGDYLGYVGEPASGERIAKDVFVTGDLYCRSGDLFRRDRSGQYYFVDRLGDTFRFKGENVSTREVEDALSGVFGVRSLLVVGVRLPSIDGRAGLAVVEAPQGLELEAFQAACRTLPLPARPCFVRVVAGLRRTESLKPMKRSYAEEGVDPKSISDPIYYRSGQGYLPLGSSEFEQIRDGQIRF